MEYHPRATEEGALHPAKPSNSRWRCMPCTHDHPCHCLGSCFRFKRAQNPPMPPNDHLIRCPGSPAVETIATLGRPSPLPWTPGLGVLPKRTSLIQQSLMVTHPQIPEGLAQVREKPYDECGTDTHTHTHTHTPPWVSHPQGRAVAWPSFQHRPF